MDALDEPFEELVMCEHTCHRPVRMGVEAARPPYNDSASRKSDACRTNES
jgi:hypothetical protein